MGDAATNPDIWTLLINIAGRNVLGRVGLTTLGIVLFFALLAWGINKIGEHAFGVKDAIFPRFTRGLARLVALWIPKFRVRLHEYLNKPPQKLTKKQQIVTFMSGVVWIAISLLMIMVLIANYSTNGFIKTFTTTSHGTLVEIQARRQPTDGMKLEIQFDRPAQIAGVWSGVSTHYSSTIQFNVRTEASVGLSDTQNGTNHIVTAQYPFATPDRSVFLYFQPEISNEQQLKVVNVKWDMQ